MTHGFFKIITFFYIPLGLLLTLYSYTQVDLNLTLNQSSLWLSFQHAMQYIGYYQRPLSAGFFLVLVLLLFGYYIFFLHQTVRSRLSIRTFWLLLFGMGGFLFFSYNAFSYDVFNYIFDAKILSFYHLNPYEYKALDFPSDPMLGFMRWTHRVYPYGPVWLLLTAPLYLLGFSYFLPTLFLFKLFMTACFFGTIYFIGEILKKTNPKYVLLGMVLFAFNPLVLIESVVSAHNDIVMMFFAVASVYLLIKKRTVLAMVFIIFSIGTKFVTAALLPVFLYKWYVERQKKVLSWENFFLLCIIMLCIAVIAVALRTNFQPWYLLYVLTFAPFLVQRHYVTIPVVILSFFALLNYVPFIAFGNWDPPIPLALVILNVSALFLAITSTVLYPRIVARRHNHSV